MIKCIIPASGDGTRFKELGRNYPKCLLPFENKPIIQYNIEKLYARVDCFNLVVKQSDLLIFKDILSLYPTYDKVVFTHPNESKNRGPLTSIWSGYSDKDSFDNYLIILSDIILEQDLILDVKENFVGYTIVEDYQRWCLVEDLDSYGKKILFDKPSVRPYSKTLRALNGIYFSSKNDFIKIGEITNTQFEEECQISFWLKNIPIKTVEIGVKDFGTLEEYNKERKTPTSRYFNNISKKSNYIINKSSLDPNKIYSEYCWFNSIPSEIKHFTIRTYSFNWNPFSYDMESVEYPTLREYIIFLGLEKSLIDKFFREFKNFIEAERKFKSNFNFSNYIIDKTSQRMEGIFSKKEIKLISDKLNSISEIIDENVTVMHGDTVASNIFFNENSGEIKLIDPKGELFGSFLYDLAKLNQSFTTPYDFIDSNLYCFDSYVYQKSLIKYKGQWENFLKENYSEYVETINILTLSLMCSLIPFHLDRPKNVELYKFWCKEKLNDLLL